MAPTVKPSRRRQSPPRLNRREERRRSAGGPLHFAAPSLSAVGLGYDAVSGRFIVGDGKEQRLLVVGERSGRLASLAGIDAGFDEVSAFEIDTVEGDLWVVSSSAQTRRDRAQAAADLRAGADVDPARDRPSVPAASPTSPSRRRTSWCSMAKGGASIASRRRGARSRWSRGWRRRLLESRARPGGHRLRLIRPRHPPPRSGDSGDDRRRTAGAGVAERPAVDSLAPRLARRDSRRRRRTASAFFASASTIPAGACVPLTCSTRTLRWPDRRPPPCRATPSTISARTRGDQVEVKKLTLK